MYTQIDSNKRKTIELILGFVAFIWLFGYILSRAIGQPGLVVIVGIAAVIYAVVGYYAAAAVTLALAKAKPVTKQQAPELYRVVENLAITAGLPMPKVYVVDDPSPNAFATGRDPQHAVVAATTGLLDIMNKDELEGVIAHELSHVGNYDIRLMAIVVVLVTVVTVLSHFFLRFTFWGGGDNDNDNGQAGLVFLAIGLVTALLAPLAATIVQLAVSRRREYLADASGALLTRYPEGLASALRKIEASKPMQTGSPATAHLYFASPFRGGASNFVANLFSTHPPIGDRIAKLDVMEANP